MRTALGVAIAIVASILVVIGSIAPWTGYAEPVGIIRLAWSARPQRIEHCRRRSDEELAGVPAHMRERVECQGRAARYAIIASIDGVPRLADTLRGGGARHEGMIHLLRDIVVLPGQRHFELGIRQIDTAATATDSIGGLASEREQRMEATRERVRREALPGQVALDTVLALEPRAVVLIGYDPDRQRFTVATGPSASR